MKLLKYPDPKSYSKILKRPSASLSEIEPDVLSIMHTVEREGDAALLRFTERFDTVSLTEVKVSMDEISLEDETIPDALKEAIEMAYQNIHTFHSAQQQGRIEVEPQKGVRCWQEKRPIEEVGLYIPGGSAPLFSSVLMLAIPATIAGCSEIVLCTPPQANGEIAPEILYAAKRCGVTQVFAVGGAQAIAAMTFGTQSVPAVDKIFGPGNQYVTVAKQLATKKGVAIDMPAGPSEVLVFADETASPAFVASDLLSQAEHGPDSQVLLISTSNTMLQQTAKALQEQLAELPRAAIAKQALEKSLSILVKDETEALAIINAYAPEHCIIIAENEDYFANGIQHAGSVFLGPFTPESAGDYASGTNHTLPTDGFARQYSGIGLDSFQKNISFQKITAEGLQTIGPAIETMAAAEGLEAHKNAVSLRLESLKSNVS
ncbi:histidinol dehydrogenase [Flavobacteriaceae bacterium TK19130]|nr:histidinol dehydrogenase [Thermobacterium salinum]